MKEANHKHNSYSYHKLVIHNGFAGIYLYAVYATRQSQLFIHIFFFLLQNNDNSSSYNY